jgi:hypothetical protein
VDTHAYQDAVIPPYYDSLIAKLIVRGKDRQEAIARMSRALEMFVVEGIHTAFRCTGESWPIRISGAATSIPALWNAFSRRSAETERRQPGA